MTYSGNQGYFGAGNVVGKDSGMTNPLNMANTGFEFQPTRVELLSSEREEFIMEVGKFTYMITYDLIPLQCDISFEVRDAIKLWWRTVF